MAVYVSIYYLPQILSFVWHGAVLDGPREHEDISCLCLHLDGVFEELISVVRIARVDVRAWTDGRAAILLRESAIQEWVSSQYELLCHNW